MNFKYQGLGTYKRHHGRFDSLKTAVKRFFVRLFKLAATVAVIALAAWFGATFYSTETITTSVQTVEAASPILDRIAECESGNSHLGKDGQVLIHLNTNGTYDIGRFQVNSIHGAEATKLGFNLYTDEGNSAYAHWLYQNRGTDDWSASRKCWAK